MNIMTAMLRGLPLLVVLMLAYFASGVEGIQSASSISNSISKHNVYSPIGASSMIFRLRAGEAITIGKRKKQKATFIYMIRAFFRYSQCCLPDTSYQSCAWRKLRCCH